MKASTPDALDVALGQCLADRVDGIECEGSLEVSEGPIFQIDATQLIGVQTAKG